MDRVIKNGTDLLTSDMIPANGRKLRLNMRNTGVDGAKTIWSDQSGNSNHYTLTDVSKVGDTMQFNGTAGSIAKRANFLKTAATAQPFTVSARMKWSSIKEWQCIFEVAQGGSIGTHFYVNKGTGLYVNPVSTGAHFWNSVVTTNTEYHIALTYDGATFIAYVDGVALASIARTGTDFTWSDVFLGSRNGDLQLEGYIKDYYVYDRALDVKEIEDLRDFGGTSEMLLTSRSKQPYATHVITEATIINGVSLPLADHSVSFWVKTYKLQDYNVVFGDTAWGSFVFHSSVNGAVFCGVGTTGSADRFTPTELPTGTIKVGEKVHLTYTYENATKTGRFYKNGVLISTKVFTSSPTALTNFRVGASDGREDMDVTDIRFYSKLKTDAEVFKVFKGEVDEVGLEMWWEFRNNLLDSSDHKRHLTSTNPPTFKRSEFPSGQRSSLSFDGVDDYIGVPSNTSFNLGTGDFSVEMWVKTNTGGTKVAMGRGAAAENFWIGVNNGVPTFNVCGVYAQDSTLIEKDKYVHLCGVRSAGTTYLYVNGIQVGTNTTTGSIDSIDELCIGRFRTGFNWPGLIANARIWSKALTASEIKDNMHRYLPSDTPNLVEQWKLDQGVGTVAYGTKGNNGTITGATWKEPTLANWRSGHVKFDGINDVVQVPFKPSLYMKEELTFETCINPQTQTAASTSGMIVNKEYEWEVAINASDGVIKWAIQTNQKAWAWIHTTYVPPIDTWTHVAFTWNRGAVKLYANGSQVYSGTYAGDYIEEYTIKHDLRLGDRELDTSSRYLGKMDETRLWNIERTATEIAENYQRVLDRHPNLVGYWRFDHDGFWDASGNGNHGTPVNGPVIEDNDNNKLNYIAPIN